MKVSEKDSANAKIICVEGEMMLGYEAEDFQNKVQSAIDDGKEKIIIDLSKVTFLSSWGIGILIHGYTTANNKNIKYCLAGLSSKLKENLAKVKLDKIFSMFASVEEALAD